MVHPVVAMSVACLTDLAERVLSSQSEAESAVAADPNSKLASSLRELWGPKARMGGSDRFWRR